MTSRPVSRRGSHGVKSSRLRRRVLLALAFVVIAAVLFVRVTEPVLSSAARGSSEWLAAWVQVMVLAVGFLLFVLPVLLALCVVALVRFSRGSVSLIRSLFFFVVLLWRRSRSLGRW